jgi:hypothetical protein
MWTGKRWERAEINIPVVQLLQHVREHTNDIKKKEREY